LPNIQFNGIVFTVILENMTINYKKYGEKWGIVWLYLKFPLNANATFQVKENSYKLILPNIQFIIP